MAAVKQVIEFDFARVYVSLGKPTEMDPVGCGGMYVERVEIKPLREWKWRSRLTIGVRIGMGLLRRCYGG